LKRLRSLAETYLVALCIENTHVPGEAKMLNIFIEGGKWNGWTLDNNATRITDQEV
jgi:hypothetical protein